VYFDVFHNHDSDGDGKGGFGQATFFPLNFPSFTILVWDGLVNKPNPIPSRLRLQSTILEILLTNYDQLTPNPAGIKAPNLRFCFPNKDGSN
jgi:hypothetical protein